MFAYDKDMGQQLEATIGEQARKSLLIDGISEMFYQSLLCPDNSVFATVSKANATDEKKNSYVNDRCVCKEGYLISGASCVSSCPTGYTATNGACVLNSTSD